jgi:hypothetical protein
MKPFAALSLLVLASLGPQLARAQDGASQERLQRTLAPHHDSALQLAFASTSSLEDANDAGLPLPKYGGWVGVTKWVTLAASLGFGAAGVIVSRNADDLFSQLDALCSADPDDCRSRNPDGSYANPVLEQLYNDVLKKDQQARVAFVGSQVAFGASVLLFIVDFQNRGGPENEPYQPEGEAKTALRLTATPGAFTLRYYFE